MRCPAKAIDEAARLQAITEYALDSGRVETLDSIVDMAARMFDCPVAAVNIIGDESVRLVSSLGIDTYDPGRDVSFCAHTILQDDVMVIEDATLDVRFHDNPLVSGGMIRFYAGTPLRTPAGQVLGALCVIDNEPHAGFPHADQVRLQVMAAMVMDRLELRRLQTAAESPRNRFEAAATASPNAILCFDADGRITEWNPAASTIFGHEASAIVGHSIERLIAREDRPKVHAGIERVLAGAVPTGESTLMTGLRANGEHFAAEIFWTRWFEGDRMQFAAIVLDISAKRSEHDASIILPTTTHCRDCRSTCTSVVRSTAPLRSGSPCLSSWPISMVSPISARRWGMPPVTQCSPPSPIVSYGRSPIG